MSRFDSRYEPQYVERLRKFLGIPKENFLYASGLATGPKKTGRVPAYPRSAVAAIEAQANFKAARCEAGDTTLGERLVLARDYAFDFDANIARRLGVSRELVRRWRNGLGNPSETLLDGLADVLGVPTDWLRHGGEQYLPAHSHLGLRFGVEALHWRGLLRADIIAEAGDDIASSAIDALVARNSDLSDMARRAGGRWHFDEEWFFAPWEPMVEPGLQRRYWSDETEVIIEEELEANTSVYAAWRRISQRCESLGLAYPVEISLYKRKEKERQRRERWGVVVERR